MATQQPVHIIEAGIAGLTLGRCLKDKGIPAILFERGDSSPRHNYCISLLPWAYQPHLQALNMHESTFRQRLAVNSSNGGIGLVTREGYGRALNSKAFISSFRAHCGRLETLLGEGLDIKWRHTLQDISRTESGISLDFKVPSQDHKRVQSTLIVDTTAVHSNVRKSLLPTSQRNILLYVVFRGTRKIERQAFEELYEPYFKKRSIIETRIGEVLLQIPINDYNQDHDRVAISYIYSRAARPDDPLHRPERDSFRASDIPEFFAEVSEHGLEPPFKGAFDVKKMESDRILHWLVRSLLVSLPELNRYSGLGVLMLGNSAHATPILGGEGANWAIKDGIELADHIAAHSVTRL